MSDGLFPIYGRAPIGELMAQLTDPELRVLIALESFAGKDGVCYPSRAEICRRVGWPSGRTNQVRVSRATGGLVDKGIIAKGSRGRGRATEYRMLWRLPAANKVYAECTRWCTESTPGGARRVHPIGKEKEKTQENNTTRAREGRPWANPPADRLAELLLPMVAFFEARANGPAEWRACEAVARPHWQGAHRPAVERALEQMAGLVYPGKPVAEPAAYLRSLISRASEDLDQARAEQARAERAAAAAARRAAESRRRDEEERGLRGVFWQLDPAEQRQLFEAALADVSPAVRAHAIRAGPTGPLTWRPIRRELMASER